MTVAADGDRGVAAGDARAPEVSVCVAVYREHGAPNVGTLARDVVAALGDRTGELIVVLNGIAAEALDLPPEVRTVALDTNHGVSIAWNRAAAVARGEVLCFVNDDLELGPGSLARLAQAFDDEPSAGVVGPSPCVWDLVRARSGPYLSLAGREPGGLLECDVVSGFCFAVRRSAFEAVGGFDEAYTPCGFEEVDLCTAIRADTDLRCFGVAGVPVEHDFGISAADPSTVIAFLGREETLGAITRRNRQHFLGKWAARRIPSVPVDPSVVIARPGRLRVAAHGLRQRAGRRLGR